MVSTTLAGVNRHDVNLVKVVFGFFTFHGLDHGVLFPRAGIGFEATPVVVFHPINQGLKLFDMHCSEDCPPSSTRPSSHALRHVSYVSIAIQICEFLKFAEALNLDKSCTRSCVGNATGPHDLMDRVFSCCGSSEGSCISSVICECDMWFHLRTIAVVLVHQGLFVSPVLTTCG